MIRTVGRRMSLPPKRAKLSATVEMARAANKITTISAVSKKPPLEIRRSTRIGEVYWCGFSPHNWPPEFDDKHLVVVVRGGKKDSHAHVVVPLTKVAQTNNPHGYRLTRNPNPGSAPESWAVCDHIYTVASERLRLLRDSRGATKEPERLCAADLAEISRRVFKALGPFFQHATLQPPGDRQTPRG